MQTMDTPLFSVHLFISLRFARADLKPDNVGFAADGTLKLFDFGLVTCVKTRESPSDSYTMTGTLI